MSSRVPGPGMGVARGMVGAGRGLIGYVFSALYGFLYPPLCVACGQPAPPGRYWLCDACLEALHRNNALRHACARCGQNRTIHPCTCEYAWDHPFERAYSLFDFDDTVRALAHTIKYRGGKDVARQLGTLCTQWIPSDLLDGVDAVTAIPLHRSRRRKRGYNQAEEIARGVCSGMPPTSVAVYDDGIVIRVRATRTQTKLGRQERETNLAGAFAPGPRSEKVAGKVVLLIDDVITTGATTGCCTEVLLAAGASSVRVLSLARD